MSRTPKAEATRKHILEAGHALVLQKGFVGVGLQEILAACSVPKGSFYHYFSSKEAFGCALLQCYLEGYRERLDTLCPAAVGNGRVRLMRYWSAWIDEPVHGGWAGGCLVVKLAAEVADLSESMRQVLAAGVTALLAYLAALIEDGRADGSLPAGAPAADLARLLYQMWLGAALLAKLQRDPAPLRQALAATETLLRCEYNAVSSVTVIC